MNICIIYSNDLPHFRKEDTKRRGGFINPLKRLAKDFKPTLDGINPLGALANRGAHLLCQLAQSRFLDFSVCLHLTEEAKMQYILSRELFQPVDTKHAPSAQRICYILKRFVKLNLIFITNKAQAFPPVLRSFSEFRCPRNLRRFP